MREAARRAALARRRHAASSLPPGRRDALAHITGGQDLALVVGHAGTGKSAMLGVAREALEAAGFAVRGAALQGIAAKNLEGGSGIASRTIAALEHGWEQGRELLAAGDVLVVNEAGMVGTRQLLSHATDAGAKVVLVGDLQQLQASQPVPGRGHVRIQGDAIGHGDMARGLERYPQLESILDGRNRDLGIAAGTGGRLGLEFAFAHGIDLGRGRSLGL